MAHTSLKTIVVLGGTGFLGRRICEIGSSAGHKIISLSRLGRPVDSLQMNSSVEWKKFDIFDAVPDASIDMNQLEPGIKETFSNADVVVHSMGILLEPGLLNYKQLLDCKASMKHSMAVGTYEHMNRDSALKLAMLAYQFPSINTFVFVSACHDVCPIIPSRYISTKIEAEKGISSLDRFRTLIFRPGMMSSPDRPITVVASAFSMVFRSIPILSVLSPNWTKAEPLSVDIVARSIISSISGAYSSTPRTEIFEIEDIKRHIN